MSKIAKLIYDFELSVKGVAWKLRNNSMTERAALLAEYTRLEAENAELKKRLDACIAAGNDNGK